MEFIANYDKTMNIYTGVSVEYIGALRHFIAYAAYTELLSICCADSIKFDHSVESLLDSYFHDRTIWKRIFTTLYPHLKYYMLLYRYAEKNLEDFPKIRYVLGIYEWQSFQEYVDTDLGINMKSLGYQDYANFSKNMAGSPTFVRNMMQKHLDKECEKMVKNKIHNMVFTLVCKTYKSLVNIPNNELFLEYVNTSVLTDFIEMREKEKMKGDTIEWEWEEKTLASLKNNLM